MTRSLSKDLNTSHLAQPNSNVRSTLFFFIAAFALECPSLLKESYFPIIFFCYTIFTTATSLRILFLPTPRSEVLKKRCFLCAPRKHGMLPWVSSDMVSKKKILVVPMFSEIKVGSYLLMNEYNRSIKITCRLAKPHRVVRRAGRVKWIDRWSWSPHTALLYRCLNCSDSRRLSIFFKCLEKPGKAEGARVVVDQNFVNTTRLHRNSHFFIYFTFRIFFIEKFSQLFITLLSPCG